MLIFYKKFLDTYIQKAKKTYQDSRSRGARNIGTLNTELHDVQRIMVQNIDDVLQRGAVLSGKFFLSINYFFNAQVSDILSIVL